MFLPSIGGETIKDPGHQARVGTEFLIPRVLIIVKEGLTVKKTAAAIILVLVCMFLAGCNEKDDFKAELDKIAVLEMSTSILDASESDQLAWLADIYQFEVDTMRSRTSDLSEENIKTVEAHLSQVFGSEEVRLLMDGFYEYDQDKRTYYVPDGDWFSYSDQWPSSDISLTDRSEQSATFVLKGIDLTENERNIQFDFSISSGKLLLENRSILD